eukprot:jgi/Chlat1/945/Chrsp108S01374
MELGAAYVARPRILVVARRTLRKNKNVDFVGEYHLDLILRFGAVPVIVPRLPLASSVLEAYLPLHGLLVVEGEDIDIEVAEKLGYSVYEKDQVMDPEIARKMKELHPSDTEHDPSKDELEFALAKRCVQKGIPYLGLCRGSQLLNVIMGGTLYADVELEANAIPHIDYNNYDGYRHPIKIVPGTPMEAWFGRQEALPVNSYHHQGVRRLAPGLKPMAYSPDGLLEGFYNPSQKFHVGLQFHPERMLDEHPGGYLLYEAFVNATRDYHRRQLRRQLQALARFHASPMAPIDAGHVEYRQMLMNTEGTVRGNNLSMFARASGGNHNARPDQAAPACSQQVVFPNDESTKPSQNGDAHAPSRKLVKSRSNLELANRLRLDITDNPQAVMQVPDSDKSVRATTPTIASIPEASPVTFEQSTVPFTPGTHSITPTPLKERSRVSKDSIRRPMGSSWSHVTRMLGWQRKGSSYNYTLDGLALEQSEDQQWRDQKRYADAIGISIHGGSRYKQVKAKQDMTNNRPVSAERDTR